MKRWTAVAGLILVAACRGTSSPEALAEKMRSLGVYVDGSQGISPVDAYGKEENNIFAETQSFRFSSAIPAAKGVSRFYLNLPGANVNESRVYWLEDPRRAQWRAGSAADADGPKAAAATVEPVSGSLYQFSIADMAAKADGFACLRVSMPLGTPDRLYCVALGGQGSPAHADAPSDPAADRRAQRRTVADMRNVGTAMFSWLTDQVGAAAAGQPQTTTPKVVDLGAYPPITQRDLAAVLVPQYIQAIPEKDGWGHPYQFFLDTAHPLAKQVMGIRSAGRDGTFSAARYVTGSFDPASFDEDIVWTDGFFVRWPQAASAEH
jgi:hypothetical protein